MEAKDEFVRTAKSTEQVEHYDDMVSSMKSATESGLALTNEERNLLLVAYMYVVGAQRCSWQVILSIEQRMEGTEDSKRLAKMYREEIEKELKDICEDVLSLLDKHLIPKASNAEAKMFYITMKGDHFHYQAEVVVGDERKSVAENSQQAYAEATEISKKKMKPSHPIYLVLALDHSVYPYKILNARKEACNLAKTAFDDAIAKLDTLDKHSDKNSTLTPLDIMQVLRDHLTLWISDQAQDKDKPEEAKGEI